MKRYQNNKDRRSGSLAELSVFAAVLFCSAMLLCCSAGPSDAQNPARASTLPDLSGMAWIKDDLFLGVHDAKRNPEKYDWPRISIVRLPKSELQGVTWRSLDLKFPGPEGPGSDLESACRIPGKQAFLFAESGQGGKHDRRIFYAVYDNHELRIESHIVWPTDVRNVEATEVCQIGGRFVFLYAERADGRPQTSIRWAPLSLNPLEIGEFKETTYQGIDPAGEGARPVVAMDIDNDGFIYTASAYDPGDDGGPFRSVVWQIGKITENGDGSPQITLGNSKRLANLDGLKVESISIRELPNGDRQIYVGTDDEHYGGIIRPLPDLP